MSAEPATLGLRERKKIKTRASIRAHAMRLFQEQGYNETSVEQIAEAAEVSPSTFFRYFPTKEDVVLADDIDPVMLEALADQPADLPPMQAIREGMRRMFAALDPAAVNFERERTKLVMSVPELRSAALDELPRNIALMASVIAGRLGRSPDDFEVKVFCGAIPAPCTASWRNSRRRRPSPGHSTCWRPGCRSEPAAGV